MKQEEKTKYKVFLEIKMIMAEIKIQSKDLKIKLSKSLKG